MIGQIITQTPVWVWGLLAALLLLGIRSMRRREVPVVVIYMTPLLGLLSVRALMALGAWPYVWGVFALAWGAGVWIGRGLEPRWILGKSGGRVRRAGEALTLVQVLVLFALNYVRNVLEAVAPAMVDGQAFGAWFAILAGVTAGVFAGRALAVWRCPDDVTA